MDDYSKNGSFIITTMTNDGWVGCFCLNKIIYYTLSWFELVTPSVYVINVKAFTGKDRHCFEHMLNFILITQL